MQRQMIVPAYLGSQCTKFSRSWVEVLIFYVLLFAVDFAMDPTKEQHQILCKSRKKCDGDSGNE
jgi:hypothetical protein